MKVTYAANVDQAAVLKRVYFEGTDTIYEGMALCYNQDTTTNVNGQAVPTTAGVTAEGYQNEGKVYYVEKAGAANIPFFAGVVARGSWCGTTGPRCVDIYIANGAIVPVRGTDSFTIGQAIYLDADYEFTNLAKANGYCGIAMETIDRSTTEGLVLAKLLPTALTPIVAVTTGHAVGVIGTGVAPQTTRRVENGEIITDIKVDLQGLASVATANDVIGLAAGGVAYIGQNVVASNGIVYKMELICLETPAGGDNDVNVVVNSSGTLAYDGAGGTTYGVNGGDAVAGQVVANLVQSLTANHYFYLTAGTGDTAAAYTAGQFIVRLFGHPVLA